ncbi:MAG: glycosyltransferase [Bacillota bacterium]
MLSSFLFFRRRLFPRLNEEIMSHNLPHFKIESKIPKIIHQTYKTRNLPAELQLIVDQLKAANPEWEYRFYADDDIVRFISTVYGQQVLAYYNRINPNYGAAKADLFRYLLMYKEGGVYLDIKSSFEKPINDILKQDDQYLLCGWDNRKGEKHEGFGLHKELSAIEGGEYEQWHIIAAPGSPFLRAVIHAVLTNIDRYMPWHRTGMIGVLQLTGPIAYTLAIHPLLSKYPHRYERVHPAYGLVYSALQTSHKTLFKDHYSRRTDSVVQLNGIKKFLGFLYSSNYSFALLSSFSALTTACS